MTISKALKISTVLLMWCHSHAWKDFCIEKLSLFLLSLLFRAQMMATRNLVFSFKPGVFKSYPNIVSKFSPISQTRYLQLISISFYPETLLM